LIVLITDGEDHESYPLEAAKAAKAAGVRIIAVGLGSESGSKIVLTDPKTGAKTEMMHDNQPVISRLDGKTLEQMAGVTGAAYDLALTFAQRGDKAAAPGQDRDVDAAIERYRDALGWFTDAKRLRPGDAETAANLERVRARMLALVDEANKGKKGLEPRLEQ